MTIAPVGRTVTQLKRLSNGVPLCPQVYVWIYDPVHFKTFAMGLILGESVEDESHVCDPPHPPRH